MQFHIDLERAIKKIASRQALNDVHFLVQLVRKAMLDKPRCVFIENHHEHWTFQHDGLSLDMNEIHLISKLLNQQGTIQDLDHIEKKYGTAFLSCFVQFLDVKLYSNGKIFERKGDFWVLGEASAPPKGFQADPGQGFLLEFDFPGTPQTNPLSELKFYCASIPARLMFNKTALNRPKSTPALILQNSWQTLNGSGLVGIPTKKNDSTFHFYKSGVLFGVRHFTPMKGMVFYGYWDSNELGFETDFRTSINNGLTLLEQQGEYLYRNIYKYFEQLDDMQKEQIKCILLRIPIALWDDSFKRIQLFHWGMESFNLCMDEIKNIISKRLSLPYSLNTRKPDCTFLKPGELFFFLQKAGLPLRMI